MTLTGARDILRRSGAARAGLFVAAFVVVAEGAVLLLAPGDTGPEPLPIDIEDYLPAEQISRAVEYRDGQRALLFAGLGIQALAVGALAVGRPAGVRAWLGRLDGRPVLGAAAVGAAVVAVAELAALPTSLWAHERAVDIGLVTQSLDAWFADQGRSLAIGAVTGAMGAAALSALIRRYPKGWWVAGSAVVVAYGAALSLLAPILIAPLFNDFEELPRSGQVAQRVIAIGERGGVEVDEVLRIDASRRSTALNAYVAGLGPTKRVVLYDNLIEDAEPAELESVVAHELAHVAQHQPALAGHRRQGVDCRSQRGGIGVVAVVDQPAAMG